MAPEPCDIQTFFDKLNGMSFFDIIETADAEATAAERCAYRLGIREAGCPQKQYADTIKEFISFMRYGVRPSGVDPSVFKRYEDVRLQVLDTTDLRKKFNA